MKKSTLFFILIFSCVVASLFFNGRYHVKAEEKDGGINNELCLQMMRYGEEAYWRGRYLDAKQYFRKAIQADPTNEKAWMYYDLATIYALAEKVEKNMNLIAPDVSTRHELLSPNSKASEVETPKPAVVPQKNEEFVIEDDEGC